MPERELSKMKGWFISKYRKHRALSMAAIIYDFVNSFSWKFDDRAVESRKKIKKLKDKYKGERCFIIGNGPSLKKTDLSLLKDEYTFGLNRIFLKFDELGFRTNFLVSVNDLVIRQSHKELNQVNSKKLFSWKNREYIEFDENTIFLRTLVKQQFSKDLTRGVWEGATVTFVAMQIAYYLGFDSVILVGVDHNFKTRGTPHKAIVSKGNDKDHFSNKYFGKGFKWNLPDLDTSEYAYKLAKKTFEQDGRKIIDATLGGKLDIYEKINYSKLFLD